MIQFAAYYNIEVNEKKIFTNKKRPTGSFVYFNGKVSFTQQAIPIVKATLKSADIKDGDNLQKVNWAISPEVKPDIYYAERFKGSKQITFYTNIDSISFTVTPGKIFNFIVVLNNKDSAYTQISTVLPPALTYKRNCTKCNTENDTIPFSVGWNNNIQIKGSINNSDVLNMIFDTGANGIVLSDHAYKKNTRLKIDELCRALVLAVHRKMILVRRTKLTLPALRGITFRLL